MLKFIFEIIVYFGGKMESDSEVAVNSSDKDETDNKHAGTNRNPNLKQKKYHPELEDFDWPAYNSTMNQ